MITAKEFLEAKGITGQQNKTISEWLLEFTKYHVEQVKLAYFEKIKSESLVTDEGIAYLENIYSLTNIK